MSSLDVRPIIVAEHASTRFGGEAILPFHYFRYLRKRGIEAWLVVHERTREELLELLPEDADRISFAPDRAFHKVGARLCERFPTPLLTLPMGMIGHGMTQLDERRLVRDLVRRTGATIVHEPIPVSPKAPSLMVDVGVPVVIGPMNGGMTFPPAFASYQTRAERAFIYAARAVSGPAHVLVPGKRRAAALIVANERTRRALPPGVSTRVFELPENAVDLTLFAPPARRVPGGKIRFAFVGRLVGWKAADLLLEASALARRTHDFILDIVGDGPERPRLEALHARLGLGETVRFHGFLPHPECAALLSASDAFVLPSLYEAGGAAVLEAMAMGLPVIATEWGGPTDYLTPETGILVPPSSREAFIGGIARAMVHLIDSPAERDRLGAAARRRVEERYDWARKIDRILEIYREAQSVTPASRHRTFALV